MASGRRAYRITTRREVLTGSRGGGILDSLLKEWQPVCVLEGRSFSPRGVDGLADVR
jgi:hypothetical protein